MNIEDKIHMLKQMRWREALVATGSEKDAHTARLITIHQAVIALEAAIADGEPEQRWDVDVDGMTLDPQHDWYRQRSS